MTILVTGGDGYIGSHMVHELADAGEAVVVVDDLSTGFRSALPKTVPLVVGDVGDGALMADVHPQPGGDRDHPFRRLDRGAGRGARSPRLLPQ